MHGEVGQAAGTTSDYIPFTNKLAARTTYATRTNQKAKPETNGIATNEPIRPRAARTTVTQKVTLVGGLNLISAFSFT